MRFSEFSNTETKNTDKELDEVLPAIGAAAGAAARLGGAVAKGAGQLATSAAKTIGKAAVKGAVGIGKSVASGVADKVAAKAQDMANKKLLKPGVKLPMPTQKGPQKEFEIDNVKGDEVTLVNPDANLKPEEPEKVTYKKKDLDTIIKNLTQGATQ